MCYSSAADQDGLITFAQLLKIGFLFSKRCVSSSYRDVKTIWHPYKSLREHFCNANVDDSRSTAEITVDEGQKKILEDSAFFGDFCLLLETFLLSKLSLELRKRKCPPYKAQIKTTAQYWSVR